MKKILFILLVSCLCCKSFAQQKDFEGVLYYTTEIKSKTEGISDKDIKTMLSIGNITTVYIKQGNTRRSNGLNDQYYISKKEKIYLRFRGIDTLFYLDYSSDTSRVINITRKDEQKSIAGFECKAITLETSSGTSQYFYAPSLYRNPAYEKNNSIGNLNIYAKETESIWLSVYNEAKVYTLSETCTRVEQKPVDETVFDLPKLPEQKFSLEAVRKDPEFTRGGGWIKYLQANLNAALGAKYIKIPKGETEAQQTVQLSFIISETGEVTDVKVLNKKEVHSKLADEAVRVVKERESLSKHQSNKPGLL